MNRESLNCMELPTCYEWNVELIGSFLVTGIRKTHESNVECFCNNYGGSSQFERPGRLSVDCAMGF